MNPHHHFCSRHHHRHAARGLLLFSFAAALGASLALARPGDVRAGTEVAPWLPPDTPRWATAPLPRDGASFSLADAPTINLDDPQAVFDHVIASLPDSVDVIPTENYTYWRFHTADKYVWGNLRLEPDTRDQGIIHIGYYEFREELTGPEEANPRYRQLDVGDALRRVDDFTYDLTYGGRTVRFLLNRVDQHEPLAFRLGEGERFVMRTEDESRIRFHLIFHEATRNFFFVADEDRAPLDGALMVSDDLALDTGTGFLFFVDKARNNRKILVGVYRRNIAQNNYYDGPADQLADNYIPNVPQYKSYLEQAYPFTRGVIDQFGFYVHDPGSRVAVAPYHSYQTITEMQGMVDVCKNYGGVPEMMACIMPGGMRQETPDDPSANDPWGDTSALLNPQVVFSEDWEGDPLGAGGWTASGLWHLTTDSPATCSPPDDFVSPVTAAYYGIEGACNYDNGGPNWGTLTSPVIPNLPDGSFLYVHSRRVSEGRCGQRDLSFIEVSVSGEIDPLTGYKFPIGKRWQFLFENCDNSNAWQELGPLSLERFAGRDIQIRFLFDAIDFQNNGFLGWMVDDVAILTGENAAGPDYSAPRHMGGVSWHLPGATFLPPGHRHLTGMTWHQITSTWNHLAGLSWPENPNPGGGNLHMSGTTFVPRPRPRPRPGGGGGGAPPPRKPPHMAGTTWHLAGVTAPPPGAKHAAGITWHLENITFIPPWAKHNSGFTWHVWGVSFIPKDAKHAAGITWHLEGITFIPGGTKHIAGTTWHLPGITFVPPGSKHAAGITWHLPGITFIPPGTKHNSGTTWHVAGVTFIPKDSKHAAGTTWHIAGATFIPKGSKHNSGSTWHVGGVSFIPPGTKHNSGSTWHFGGQTFIPPGTKHNSGSTWHVGGVSFIPPGTKHNSGSTWHVGGQTFIPPGTKHNSGVTWHVAGASFIPPDAKHNSGFTWHYNGQTFIPAGTIHNSGITWHYNGQSFIPPGTIHNSGFTWHYNGQSFIPPGTIHNSGITWHFNGESFIPAGTRHNSGITWHVNGVSFIPPGAKHVAGTTWHMAGATFMFPVIGPEVPTVDPEQEGSGDARGTEDPATLVYPSCTVPADCPPLECHSAACNPEDNLCEYTATPGDPCDDGDPASTGDTCNQFGDCIGVLVPGNPCDDFNPCTGGDTINNMGQCVGAPTPFVPCDPGNPCIIPGSASCDPMGNCVGMFAGGMPCDDGDETTLGDMCDPFLGTCAGSFDLDCDDLMECNGQEECDPLIGVIAGTPPDCLFPCQGLHGVCVDNDPANSGCVGQGADENFDLPNDCAESECDDFPEPDVPVDCDDDNPCTVDDCDPSTGDCVNTPVPDGTTCDSGDDCAIGTCQSGICERSVIVDCTGLDCNQNGLEDGQETAGGLAPDCNNNRQPDECDVAPEGPSQDLNNNGVPDECEGLVNPAAVAPAPHDRQKNRYISFAPNNLGSVAFKVRRVSPGPAVDVGWVSAPDANGLAKIEPGPVTRVWNEATIHGGDCEIVPVAEFEVLATADGVTFAPGLIVPTIDLPSGGKFWGDTVGSFDGIQWTAPNNIVNANDFLAALQKFQNLPTAPHITVVDVQSVSSIDPCLNRIANIADVFLLLQAFQGNAYPFTTNPATCPPCP